MNLLPEEIKTQLIEHRIEWKAIIITLIEMSGRKRKQLTLGSWKGFNTVERILSLIYKVPI